MNSVSDRRSRSVNPGERMDLEMYNVVGISRHEHDVVREINTVRLNPLWDQGFYCEEHINS